METARHLPPAWTASGGGFRWAPPLDGVPQGHHRGLCGREGQAPDTAACPPPSTAISSMRDAWPDRYSEDFCQPQTRPASNGWRSMCSSACGTPTWRPVSSLP